MPYDYQHRDDAPRPWDNVLRQDREFTARAARHLDPVETVIGCRLQSHGARATSADPRFR